MTPKMYLGQAFFFAAIMAFMGYFSASPVYTHVPSDKALIKVSFSHGAKRVEPCRKRTREELMALPPNMRKPMSCSRERRPLGLLVTINNEVIIDEQLPPMGLAKDGEAKIYRRVVVDPGEHRLQVGIVDSDRESGYDYSFDETVTISARQNLIIDFHSEKGVFLQNETETDNAVGAGR